MSKIKATILLMIVVLCLVGCSVLAINGAAVSVYDILPVSEGIQLGLDLSGGVYAVYEADDTDVEDFAAQMSNTLSVLRHRLDAQGYTEATVTRQGTDRIRVEIPNVDDPNEVINIIGTPAKLEFREPSGEVILTGAEVLTAEAVYTTEEGPIVSLELNSTGASAFAEATARLLNQTISIYLDDEVISSPTVQTVISAGECMISNIGSIEEAEELAMLIESGALPLDLEQLEVKQQSATLGADVLATSLKAAVIGIILLFIYMIVVYRVLGVLADIALTLYILIVMYALAIVPSVQLTLPGIAGILLGIGMAVDANVIIFERIKEDMAVGRSLRMCTNTSFKRALVAIIDANVTTIIAALVLMFFGTGSVKGYAVTLTISVVVSMITSVLVTRWLLKILAAFNWNHLMLYGVRKGGKKA